MAYNPTKLGVVYGLKQSNFETAQTSSAVISANAKIEAEVFMPPTTREVFERAATKGGFYEIAPVSGSPYGAEFTISKPLNGVSSSLPPTNIGETPASQILKALLGSAVQTNYQAAGANSSQTGANVLKINNGEESSYGAGSALMTSSLGAFIASIDAGADSITPELDFTTPPTGSAAVYGSNTVYLSTAATDAFTFVWRTKENQTQLVLQGCVPTSATITLGPKDGYPRLEATFLCNKVVSETAGSALADFDYSFPVLPVPTSDASARMVFATSSGASGATELDIEGLQIAITQELVPQLSHNAATGVTDVLVTNRSVECSFRGVLGSANPYDTTGKVLTDIANSAPKAIQCQIGGTAGQSFMMLIPSPIQTAVPAVEDMGGVFGLSFMVKPGNHGGTGATVADSDFRVAFL